MTQKETYSNNNYDDTSDTKSRQGSQHDLQSSSSTRHNHEAAHGARGEEIFENRIYVGGVPAWMGDPDLFEYFSKYGEVENAVVLDRSSEQGPNRYGFVTFSTSSQASVKKLLQEIDQKELTVTGGRTLTVGPARQKTWNKYGGWSSGHGGHGGRYHHGQGGYGGDRRRPHQQSWGRRGDNRSQTGGEGGMRKKEDRSMTAAAGEKEGKKEVCKPAPHVHHHAVVDQVRLPPQHVHDVSPAMMMQSQPGLPYPAYPDYPGAGAPMMYPNPYLAPAANMGYMEYYDQQMMMMPAHYYSQTYSGMVYPVMYPPQYYNQPPQQPLYPHQQPPAMYPPCPPEMLSDSGFHDITSGSLLYHDQTHQLMPEQLINTSPGEEQQVETSPILNMSSVLNNAGAAGPGQHEMIQFPGAGGGQVVPGDSGPRTRCFNSPYKQFTPFTSGDTLDPLGNKFPFRGPGHKNTRNHSQSEGDVGEFIRNDVIIKPPNNNEMTEENFKKDHVNKRSLENQPDILQESLKTLTIN